MGGGGKGEDFNTLLHSVMTETCNFLVDRILWPYNIYQALELFRVQLNPGVSSLNTCIIYIHNIRTNVRTYFLPIFSSPSYVT